MNGAKALFTHPPDVSWGLGYSAWLRLMTSLCGGNTVNAYYVSHALLLVALPLSLFAFTRALRVSPLAATLLSMWVLASNVTRIWPFVILFAMSLLLLFCAAAAKATTSSSRVAILCLGTMVASLARPELMYASLLFAAIYGIGRVNSRGNSKGANAVATVPLLAGAAVVFGTFWVPYLAHARDRGAPDRLQIAFSQHYALGYAERNHLSSDSWSDHKEITRHAFGGDVTALTALRSNPREFFSHVFHNVVTAPGNVLKIVAPSLGPEKPTNLKVLPKGKMLLAVGGLALAALTVAFLWWLKRRGIRLQPRKVPDSWLYGIPCLPFAISVFVLYPRYHYLLPLLVIAAPLALARYSRVSPEGKPDRALWAALLGGCLLLPNSAVGWSPVLLTRALQGGRPTRVQPHPVLDQANAVRSAVGDRPLVLADDTGLSAYLPLTVRSVPLMSTGLSFSESIQSLCPTGILVDWDGLPKGTRSDTDLLAFRRDAKTSGFPCSRPVGVTSYVLYLR